MAPARMAAAARRHAGWLAASAAALAWLPFLGAPTSADEGGYLLVASQWQPGTSVYGSYWVDRPPVLIAIFALASHAGGVVALRIMGVAAVVAAVLLARRLSTAAAGRGSVVPVLVPAIFLSTPLFGTTEVSGELFAVPLVLGGVLCAVRAQDAAGGVGFAWAAAAGTLGATAALVKQNVVDVFVVVAVLAVVGLRRRGLPALGPVAAAAAGALATLALVLGLAAARGTDPGALWSAVVEFRAEAAVVIERSASTATTERMLLLAGAALLSGAPLVVLALAGRLRARPTRAPSGTPDLRASAVALLGWETVAAASGGSYWLHYLIGLVPGMTLLAVTAAQRPAVRRSPALVAGALAFAVVSASSATVVAANAPPDVPDDAAVVDYLRQHSADDDTVVVAFGHPNIVWDSGLQSPYEQLWSLPVRVRDPHLHELAAVLASRRRPTWVVVSGQSLDTWGVSSAAAQDVLERRFDPVADIGSYVVWRDAAPHPPAAG